MLQGLLICLDLISCGEIKKRRQAPTLSEKALTTGYQVLTGSDLKILIGLVHIFSLSKMSETELTLVECMGDLLLKHIER